jgi:hypothetical protein
VWRKTSEATFELYGTASEPAIIGTTLDAFPPGPVGCFDRVTSLTVKVAGGALNSVGDLEMLAGRNRFAICGADGAWETFGCAGAELIAENTYRLSRFMRGLGGEETLARRTVATGAPIVALDTALVGLGSGLATLGAATTYRIGPLNRGISDPICVEIGATATGKALMPYAPVKAAANRGGEGIVISFLRRGRRDADAWDPVEIPLGETSEAYEIEILAADGTTKRVLAATTTQVLYAAADEIADFGAPQAVLNLSIRQMSASVGAGFALSAQVAVN